MIRYGLRYTHEEIEFIRRYNNLMTSEQIARALPGRTQEGIKRKRQELGLRKYRTDLVTAEEIEWLKVNSGKKTFSDMWRQLCRSKSTIHRLIRTHGIKTLPRPKLNQADKNRKARERMARLRARRKDEVLSHGMR